MIFMQFQSVVPRIFKLQNCERPRRVQALHCQELKNITIIQTARHSLINNRICTYSQYQAQTPVWCFWGLMFINYHITTIWYHVSGISRYWYFVPPEEPMVSCVWEPTLVFCTTGQTHGIMHQGTNTGILYHPTDPWYHASGNQYRYFVPPDGPMVSCVWEPTLELCTTRRTHGIMHLGTNTGISYHPTDP